MTPRIRKDDKGAMALLLGLLCVASDRKKFDKNLQKKVDAMCEEIASELFVDVLQPKPHAKK